MRLTKYNAIDSQLDYLDTSLRFSREVSCFVLPEQGIISTTTNHSSGSVDFDWFTIHDKIWALKTENKAPECVYMLHTHPMGYNQMSSTDRNMVYGWVAALWIPIWFLIVTEEEVATYICAPTIEKKIERDLLDLSKHEDLCVELQALAHTMYGLSKAVNLSDEELNGVFNQVQEADLSWANLHEWNRTRAWNQVTPYSE